MSNADGIPAKCEIYRDDDNAAMNGGRVLLQTQWCVDGSYSLSWDMDGLAHGSYYVCVDVTGECGSIESDYSARPVVFGTRELCADVFGHIGLPFAAANRSRFVDVDDADVWRLVYAETGTGLRMSEAHRGDAWSVPRLIVSNTGNESAFRFGADIAYPTIDIMYVGRPAPDDSAEVFYTGSLDGGVTWSQPRLVSPSDDERSREPAIARSQGVLHALWRETVGSASNPAIVYARSANDGVTWTAPIELSEPAVNIRVGDDYPVIKARGSVVHAAWAESRSNRIVYRRSSDGGVTWQAQKVFAAEQCRYVDLYEDGTFVALVWRDGGLNAVGFVRSVDAGESFEDARQITFGTAHDFPRIVGTPQGRLYVFQEGPAGIEHVVSNDFGTTWCLATGTVFPERELYPYAFPGNGYVGVIAFRESDHALVAHYTPPAGNVVPVVLKRFIGSRVGLDVNLEWTLSDGIAFESYDVLMFAGEEYTKVNQVPLPGSMTSFVHVGAPESEVTYSLEGRQDNGERMTLGSVSIDRRAPRPLTLSTAAPNPFVDQTSFEVELPEMMEVSLSIYDVRGRRVGIVHQGVLGAGRHAMLWRVNDSDVASGIYFARLETPVGSRTRRVVLVR